MRTHTHTHILGVPPQEWGTKWDKTYHVSSRWEQTLLTHCSLEALSLRPTTVMHRLTRALKQGCADSHTSLNACKHYAKRHTYIQVHIKDSFTLLLLCGLFFSPLIGHTWGLEHFLLVYIFFCAAEVLNWKLISSYMHCYVKQNVYAFIINVHLSDICLKMI